MDNNLNTDIEAIESVIEEAEEFADSFEGTIVNPNKDKEDKIVFFSNNKEKAIKTMKEMKNVPELTDVTEFQDRANDIVETIVSAVDLFKKIAGNNDAADCIEEAMADEAIKAPSENDDSSNLTVGNNEYPLVQPHGDEDYLIILKHDGKEISRFYMKTDKDIAANEIKEYLNDNELDFDDVEIYKAVYTKIPCKIKYKVDSVDLLSE